MNRAEDEMACRSWAGWCWKPCCLPALTSSAAAPAACGEAIEVPLNIEYPGGSTYVPATGPPGCHSGVDETAAPGAMMLGLNPPSSRGPRELNGCWLSANGQLEPYSAAQVASEMYVPTLITFSATEGSPTVLAPGPLLPAEMNICTLNCSMSRL